jgi:hypothetical protein
MWAALLLDHRLAFLCLAALLLAAAVPLALAWALILPEDAPPFAIGGDSSRSAKKKSNDQEAQSKKHDPVAIALLACVTLSFVLQCPGFPREPALRWLAAMIPETQANWILLGGGAFFIVVPGLAACYSILRPNLLRRSLLAAGILVVLLWLLAPLLRTALVAM